MKKLSSLLKEKKILISDGAWGTFLQQKGLKAGDCPEEWNLNRPDDIYDIAKSYIDAEADMVETNSFGASTFKLDHYGLGHLTYDINKAAAQISRSAAGSKLVLGSIGPTGKFLMMGDVTKDELKVSYTEQVKGLRDGGADAICFETFYDIDEAVVAVSTAKEICELDIICTFSFENKTDDGFKSMMGAGIADSLGAVKDAGADIIGTNCGNGFATMIEIVKEINTTDIGLPVLVHANAGIPVIKGDELEYPESPENIRTIVPGLIEAGVNIIGGCCGTTPAHIKAIKETVSVYF